MHTEFAGMRMIYPHTKLHTPTFNAINATLDMDFARPSYCYFEIYEKHYALKKLHIFFESPIIPLI